MVSARHTARASDDRPSPAPVLLTGFNPFGGDPINPSWRIAQALHGRLLDGHRVVAEQLPTVFGSALVALDAALARHRPTLVICLGLASGRGALSVERIAINVDDARIADNAGAQPIDIPIVPGGPAAYFSTLPIKAMRDAILAAGVPGEISQTAGTFVCNHVFYGLMHRLATVPALKGARGGFIHVPMLPEQGAPSLPLADMVEGLRAGIRTALATTGDVRSGGGAIH